MATKIIFNRMNRSLHGGHFVLWIVSAPVVKDCFKSVALCVVYERKCTQWKELTGTVINFIAKDSLPTYMYTLMNFAACY